jgi:DnaJ-domain-containing protein 1
VVGQWWEVLGVSPQAPIEEIRRSYAAKIKQYHPDRVNGLAPELVELAERKTKELTDAFAKARRV